MVCLKHDVDTQECENQPTYQVPSGLVPGCLLVNDADQSMVVSVEANALVLQRGIPCCICKNNGVKF